jgi:outer membrane protein TolC
LQERRLEAQVDEANQTLKIAEQTFRSARAAIGMARSQEVPTEGAGTGVRSVRESTNEPHLLGNLVNNGSGDFTKALGGGWNTQQLPKL